MIRKFFLGIVFFVSIFFISSHVTLASYRDDNPDFDGTLIDQDTTWLKSEEHIFDKPVVIADGAKLSIEPGTHVVFKRTSDGYLTTFEVYEGSVEALGTAEDPIFFERASDADAFYINFSNWTDQQSILRYVHIVGGGEYVPAGDGTLGFLKKFFIPKALAYDESGTAALVYWSGKLMIEHSVFSESLYIDVWVYESQFETWMDESDERQTEPSLLVIQHSDFNGDVSIEALSVEESGCDDFLPDCPRKVTFLNNW